MAVTQMHAASREALADAEHRLDGVLAAAEAVPATVGEELYAFARVLAGEISLRRALADASAAEEARRNLARRLTDGKLGEAARQVLDTVVTSRWSSPRELLDGVRALAASALLIGAERDGDLETVEGELFGVSRMIAVAPDLDRALADEAGPADAKRELVRRVFSGKVSAATLKLVEQAATQPKGRSMHKALEELGELAAKRREQSVAHVITASPLSAEQREALAGKLNRIYGRSIAVHEEVRPNVLGGIVVKVGDEVIDGSSAGRIMALRGRLAG